MVAMAHDLCTDLDELFAQRGQRPPLDGIGQRKHPLEVAEVVSQGVKMEPGLVVVTNRNENPAVLSGSELGKEYLMKTE